MPGLLWREPPECIIWRGQTAIFEHINIQQKIEEAFNEKLKKRKEWAPPSFKKEKKIQIRKEKKTNLPLLFIQG